jgi:cysteine and histidine-rich domain-containing protein
VACRFDWHQTASNVTISVYAKLADPSQTSVEVNKVTAKISIVFDDGKSYFNKEFILRGVSSITVFAIVWPIRIRISADLFIVTVAIW